MKELIEQLIASCNDPALARKAQRHLDTNNWSCRPDGQYAYVSYEGRPGFIQIKAEDDRFIVDVFDEWHDHVATTFATYGELE